MADAITEVSIEYLRSPLNGRGEIFSSIPQPESGYRSARANCRSGAGDRPRFVLCADTSDAAARSAAAVLVGLYGHLVEETVRAPFARGGMWLVRPDGYIAMATRAGEWDDVAAYLERITTRR